MAQKKKQLSYDELLQKNPDQTLWRTSDYFKESTPEETKKAKKARLAEVGYIVKFIQEHGLTRKTLCETAPDIPEGFCVFLRDITPEGLEFYRTGYMKWLKRFERNMNADPSDLSVMEKALAEIRKAPKGS